MQSRTIPETNATTPARMLTHPASQWKKWISAVAAAETAKTAIQIFVDFLRVTRRKRCHRATGRLGSSIAYNPGGLDLLSTGGAAPALRIPHRRPALPADPRPPGPGVRDVPVLRAAPGRKARARLAGD